MLSQMLEPMCVVRGVCVMSGRGHCAVLPKKPEVASVENEVHELCGGPLCGGCVALQTRMAQTQGEQTMGHWVVSCGGAVRPMSQCSLQFANPGRR